MREVEIKAKVKDVSFVRDKIIASCGEGKTVDKGDFYFHVEGVKESAFRIRNNNGVMEMTAKKKTIGDSGESNLEFEFTSEMKEFDNAVAFFRCIGYELYYQKTKKGWDWHFENAHIELLEVNDLGYFLEIEELLDFDAKEDVIAKTSEHVKGLLLAFGCSEESICAQTYKSMILKEE